MIHASLPPMPSSGIGDVTSNARGSGARYNTGKPDLSLIPLTIVARSYESRLFAGSARDVVCQALHQLGEFQTTGKAIYLESAIHALSFAWRDAARVLTYGTAKYAPWNWAKGMPWSVPVACAARHALSVLEDNEELDPESGESHVGHFLCNLVMLRTYIDNYPEGNDLPDPAIFNPTITNPKEPA